MGNDPLNAIDPLGEIAAVVVGAAGLLAAYLIYLAYLDFLRKNSTCTCPFKFPKVTPPYIEFSPPGVAEIAGPLEMRVIQGFIIGDGFAQAKSSTSGDNKSAQNGKAVHKAAIPPDLPNGDKPPNWKKDYKIPGTDYSADYFDDVNGRLVEMKPMSRVNILRAMRQLDRYEQALIKAGIQVNEKWVQLYPK